MRTTFFFIIVAAPMLLAGCINFSDPIGAKRAEQSIGASCQAWDQRAEAAANPDAATIAKHDAMLRQVNALEHTYSGDVESTAEKAAQIQIEADDLYDWRGKLQIANQCWASLGVFHEDNQERMRQLSEMAARMNSSPAPTYSFPVSRPLSSPPAPPSPIPANAMDAVPVPPSTSPEQRCIGQVPVAGIGLNPCPN